jgi:Uma2 family endonuclease
MSLATIAPPEFETVADLLESLGDIPPDRVRMRPFPGTATEDDVIAIHAREKRLCELVDGVLVEKAMGFDESRMASEIIVALVLYLRAHDVGTVAGEGGMLRLLPGLVRIPDVCFVSWAKLPKSYGQIPPIAPDLAIEVLSPSNTRMEMARKLRDYFSAGTRLVWYFDLKSRTVTVYTSPERYTVLDDTQILEGGDVLPGFAVHLGELFDRASQRGPIE